MFWFLFITFLIFFYMHYRLTYFYWQRRSIPQAFPLPILGTIYQSFFKTIKATDHENVKKLGKIYGGYFGNIPILFINDSKFVKDIITSENTFSNEIFPFNNTPYLKDSLILQNSEKWKQQRIIISPIFTTKKLKDLTTQIEQISNLSMKNIEENLTLNNCTEGEVYIYDISQCYCIDIIAKFVFALNLNTYNNKKSPFYENIVKIFNIDTMRVFRNFFLPKYIQNMFNLTLFDSNSLNYFVGLIRKLIDERKNKLELKYNDFLELLLESLKTKEYKMNEDEIIGNSFIFFFAGIQNVNESIFNTLYCLLLNRECQEKLYDELISILNPNEPILYEKLNNLIYLEAVIKESFRLFPVIQRLIRSLTTDWTLDNYKIQKGTHVFLNICSVQNDPDNYEDPHLFKPERFLTNENHYNTSDKFLPFGLGNRKCPALRLTLIEIKYFVAKVILNYELYQSKSTQVPIKFKKNLFRDIPIPSPFGIRKRHSNFT